MVLKRQQTLAKCKQINDYPGKRARNGDLKIFCPLHPLHCRNKMHECFRVGIVVKPPGPAPLGKPSQEK